MQELIISFTKWTPTLQLAFAVFVGIVLTAWLVLAGVWLLAIIDRYMGRKKDEKPKKQTGIPMFGYPPNGWDWKEEQKKIAEEAAYQAKLQEESMREQLERAAKFKEVIVPLRQEATHVPECTGSNGHVPEQAIPEPVGSGEQAGVVDRSGERESMADTLDLPAPPAGVEAKPDAVLAGTGEREPVKAAREPARGSGPSHRRPR